MKNELNLSVVSENGTVTILEGKALEQKEQRVIDINGILNNPAEWLKKRITEIDAMQAHVVVNREKMTILLVTEEKNHYATKIAGALQLHPDFTKFEINTGEYMTAFDMAHLFKMNRSCFEVQNEAMNLVTKLQNFKATVNKELENNNNNRGDRKVLIDQTVKSNLPEAFTLCIPIFKGQPKETFEVEVYVKADDLSCTLVSPGANDLVAKMRDKAIDDVIAKIVETCPEIVVLEQ
jgi:hypothetical protein